MKMTNKILGLALLAAVVGCSDDETDPRITNPTPNNDGFVDEVPMCEADARDYSSLDARFPWAGEERFYRLDPDEFCTTTSQVLLEVDDTDTTLDDVKVLISPHAGWQFSGIVTATMLSQIEVPDLVIFIGNNHKDNGEKYAVYPDGMWALPNGDMEVDEAVAAQLIENVPDLVADKVAHSEEHSIEVNVMWLSRFNPNAKIVPIAFDYTDNAEKLKELGTAIANELKTLDQDFLVIATTDLTHYDPRDVAKEQDDAMVAQMEAMDPDGLFNLVHPARGTYSMCGLEPSVVGIQIARELGATGGEVILRRDSGDRTGNTDSVVGYAGVAYR